jgi:hypothetical protein
VSDEIRPQRVEPAPGPGDPMERLLLRMAGDIERWSRISLEYQRRGQLLGPDGVRWTPAQVAESLTADVDAGRL